MFDPCTVTWKHSSILAKRTEHHREAPAHRLKTNPSPRWKWLFLAALSAQVKKMCLASIIFSPFGCSTLKRSKETSGKRRQQGEDAVNCRWEVWTWGGRRKLRVTDAIDPVTPVDMESLETECPVLQINWSHYSCGSPRLTTTHRRLRTSTAVIKH